jgi:hypothetical protein
MIFDVSVVYELLNELPEDDYLAFPDWLAQLSFLIQIPIETDRSMKSKFHKVCNQKRKQNFSRSKDHNLMWQIAEKPQSTNPIYRSMSI